MYMWFSVDTDAMDGLGETIKCSDIKPTCPHCGHELTDEEITRLKAQRDALRRVTKTPGTGRPKTLKPCPKCGLTFGVRELRKHKC